MNYQIDNIPRTFPPRPLTDGERQLLLDWSESAGDFSAFLSQRQSDDPAIYERIVVFLRATKRHLYLVHCPHGSNRWIVASAVERENIGYFPTLRDALNSIQPVTLPARVDGPPNTGKDSVMRFEQALQDTQATIFDLQHRLDAANQRLQSVQAELVEERQTLLEVEETLRAALHVVNEWKSRNE